MVIYLDNNATTRPLDCVIEAMLPIMREGFANPSSLHRPGQDARHRIDIAREQVASLINAEPKEILFTSGGTESINLAIRGIMAASPNKRHVITSTVEHAAVHSLAGQLRRENVAVDEISVDEDGRLDTDELEDKITQQTAVISVAHANNETGILFDVRRVIEIASQKGVPVHLDAVQSAGKIPLDVKQLPATLLSFSAHKLHGPKGVGALYLRRRTRLSPMLMGGQQEAGLRPGTENTPGIVGFGIAAQEAARLDPAESESIRCLRDDLETRIKATIPCARIIGESANRLCNTSSIGFERLAADAILLLLSEQGIAASAGSACSSGAIEPSRVLNAMGIPPEIAHGAIRFSLSRFTTKTEIERTAQVLSQVVGRLSSLAH